MKIIVIDTDSLSRVFDEGNREHPEYEPLHNRIFKQRNVKIAYGGEKYAKELENAPKYRRLFSELKTAQIAIELDNYKVNQSENRIVRATKGTQFNDQHIIAIVIEGKCNIICSRDSDAYPFFKNKHLYPKNFRIPGIYNGRSSCSILN